MDLQEHSPIASAIEAEFSSHAKDERNEKIRQLTSFANEVKEPLIIREGGMVMIVTCGLVAALLMFVAMSKGGSRNGLMGMLGMSLLVLAFTGWMFRKYGRTVLTLGVDGVRIGKHQEVLLPWAAFDDYHVVSHSINGFPTSIEITFDLAPDYTPPAFHAGRFIRYIPKKSKIWLRLNTLKGMNGDSFAESFGRYWQSGLARLELQEEYGVALPA